MGEYSVSEAVKITINLLGTMRIPASELKTNGQIIMTAIDNLQMIHGALVKAEKEAKEKEEAEAEKETDLDVAEEKE